MFRIDAPHLAWTLENLVDGTVVNQITVDPETAIVIGGAVEAGGGRFLEAPVSGSKKPAEDGTYAVGEVVFSAKEGIEGAIPVATAGVMEFVEAYNMSIMNPKLIGGLFILRQVYMLRGHHPAIPE